MKIINVVGTRPNFIKIAPIMKEMKKYDGINALLIHTGQHYDVSMSKKIFKELDIPLPDINLGVGSDSHARQTAKIMVKFEEILLREKPDLVLVTGDVNSTLACAVTAKKLFVKVAHVEAGLRSRDFTMPEEINRIVTDAIADYLFTTSKTANENLKAEGVEDKKIFYVGNIMIDTLMTHRDAAEKMDTYKSFDLEKNGYVLLTMHRPGNVDDRESLENLLDIISDIGMRLPVVFPAHPRTMINIKKFGLEKYINEINCNDIIGRLHAGGQCQDRGKLIHICPPLGYKELLNLNMNSMFVITDSGGLQEETTVCGIPCLTIRETTERPETVSIGSNVVVGTDRKKIMKNVESILSGKFKKGETPELWDGKTAQRLVKILANMT
jgi:UDP-N-acetylglucosamine 2-epimerase (non-hydrolysing)